MKRNKPLVKQRKAGTQHRRRSAYWFRDRATAHWVLAVPQAFAGVHETVFDMTGAVPAGNDVEYPESPRFGSVLRWRIDRNGQTAYVYGLRIGSRFRQSPSISGTRVAASVRRSIPTSSDVYHVFVAERDVCTRGAKCTLTRYFYTYSGHEVASHMPERCPTAVLDDGPPWRLVCRTVPDGRLIL
ncbi:hypothetical protein [Streptomyces rhizosphaericus]|uniref:hypothetical protein n=1 Tax=Streptomyces rhizosphaericus TaxID=114699 RepID=UPI000A36AFC4|nr:hypothetical protein [Streptomyces rhizosphaericus]